MKQLSLFGKDGGSFFTRYVFIRVMSRRKSVTGRSGQAAVLSRVLQLRIISWEGGRGTEVGAFASSNLVVYT